MYVRLRWPESIDATHSSAEPLEMYVASITLVLGKVSLQGRLKDFFLIYYLIFYLY